MKRTKHHTSRSVKLTLLQQTSGLKKLVFSLLLAIIVYLIDSFFKMNYRTSIILTWDTFCLSMIAFALILFFTTTHDELCDVVELQDDGLKAIFFIVLVAVCISLFGTLLLLTSKDKSSINKLIQTLVSLSPVILSWILLHVTFAIRYAHLYHDHNKLHTGSIVGGIEYPGKEQPDYVDFAYFSFVIGMTFQVSDTRVESRVIRRFVLLHSLISFVFNTVIVSLTINTIAGLKA